LSEFFIRAGNGTSLISDLDSLSSCFGGVSIDQTEHSMHVMLSCGILGSLYDITEMTTPDLSSKPTMNSL
jgi:hypothetical protein